MAGDSALQITRDVAVTGGRLAGPIAKKMLDYLLTGEGSTRQLQTGVPVTTDVPATTTPGEG